MEVRFRNLSQPVKSSRYIKMYREGNKLDATVKIETYSTKRNANVKNATIAMMVSRMKESKYPYVLDRVMTLFCT